MQKTGVLVLTALSFLLAFGVAGYSFIEGWTLAEAFYMTIITITTTGYQEVNPLSPSGRMFTVFLLAGGIATLAFSTHIMVQELMSVDLKALRRKKMLKKIQSISDHTIVCGFGRMGKIVCKELEKAGMPFVVVDKFEENFKDVPEHYHWLLGDATDDQLLINAGIKRAKTLAAMVDSDADSLYLTLAARSLNPEINITSRASQESAKLKIKRAGADQVVQPLQLSGHLVAKMIQGEAPTIDEQGSVATKVKLSKKDMSEFQEFAGQSVIALEKAQNFSVTLVISADGEVIYREQMNRTLQEGDQLLVSNENPETKASLKLVS